MDNMHPIPQNVTSFQFKLIGDMTLKQFAYLAVGSAIAYLLFVFLARDYPLAAWPLIVISALLGVAFAFLPIGSRPLDHWLKAFLKAVYTPTKRIWKKNGKTYNEDPLFDSRLVMYLAGVGQINKQSLPFTEGQIRSDETGKSENQNSDILTHRTTDTPISSGTPASLPTKEELQKTVELAREAQQLQMRIIQTERTLSQMKDQAQKPAPIPADYSQQVKKTIADLQNLITQASLVRQRIQTVQEGAAPKSTAITEALFKEKIKVVVPAKLKQVQVALTTFPNVINGIVKDIGGNYMEGVVTVIYDKEGLPVRALKTNKLGQFTGSTPLPNGTYTLEVEKDNFRFDVLQIELTGDVLPPLQITAK